MMKLGTKMGDGAFNLPLDAVTQTFAILAKRGTGKTYTASVMAEEMLRAGQQVVAIDPTGAWWGLRSEFPIAVLGGEHGDVPLEESAGEVVARAIVENRFSAVLDLSLFRKGQMIRFMVAFAETLYRLNREAVHLFVDEADAVAPQAKNYGGDENRMLGAMEDIVRRGRKRGIGCTLITQRPAVLNKNALTQCEVLVALRLVHPKDIDAIEEWVNVHADPAQAKSMIASLPSLPIGTAWFWSPGWGDIFERVKIRARTTFDSGATPKPGQQAKAPAKLAKVDVERLGKEIASTVEKAKANDPAALRRQITDLQRQLAARPSAERIVEKIVEVPVLKNGQLDRTEKILERLTGFADRFSTEAAELRRLIAPASQPCPVARPMPKQPTPPRAVTPRPASTAVADTSVGKGLKYRMLVALCQFPDGLTRKRLAALAGGTMGGGAFGARMSELRTAGYVVDTGVVIRATQEGVEAVGNFEPLPTGAELVEYWRGRIGGGLKLDLFNALIDAYPKGMTREELGAATNSEPSGGSFGARLSELKSLGLIDGGRGELRACDELF